jgi:outer membrane protein OmpA-like peptidoglycan-associated protein
MLQRGFSVSTTTSVSARSTSTSLSRVFRYHFPVGGSNLSLSPNELAEIMPPARQANKIVVRARTDANAPSNADLLTAQRRAESAKRILIANGVPANKIMLNYVSADDYLGDNSTTEGRALNRRVEIEVFGQQG